MAVLPRNNPLMNNTMTSNHTSARSTIYGSGERKSSIGRAKPSTAALISGRSNSREKSYSRVNLRTRDDPQLKARLDNLMKSASTYKTKACGTTRRHTPSASRIVIEKKRAINN